MVCGPITPSTASPCDAWKARVTAAICGDTSDVGSIHDPVSRMSASRIVWISALGSGIGSLASGAGGSCGASETLFQA